MLGWSRRRFVLLAILLPVLALAAYLAANARSGRGLVARCTGCGMVHLADYVEFRVFGGVFFVQTGHQVVGGRSSCLHAIETFPLKKRLEVVDQGWLP